MHDQTVLIEKIGKLIEEEVVISKNGIDLTCFATKYSRELIVGSRRNVELTLVVFDEYNVRESLAVGEELNQIDGGFAYFISGRLIEGKLHSKGFVFGDDVFESEFSYLDGSLISINVDRINIKFIN
jgi:hypothetical protein